ncbi:hypothetical protein MBT84_46355 [Streptomyces sp. MBT84]|nr:hypothetical protein [Streptomyces sp. MBT84]
MPVQSSTVTLTSSITVADGIFAPGHLGELTRQLPFELVDDVLERTGGTQRRLRLLPSRVGVYFVLALALFPQLGYVRVWNKLTAGLRGVLHRRPSEKALREVRRRLGVAPLRLLFETLAGPVAQPITPGVRYRCWRTVAFDGCSSTKAPDRPRVCAWLGKHKHRYGTDGYPMLKIMVLCETGTRALLGAVFGPTPEKETGYAEQLLPLLDDGMLLLNDRGFDSDDFLAKAAATGAQLLVRLKGTRTPARWALLPDGSFLTRINGTRLRIIDAHIAVTTAKGLRLEGHYRLATTLTDHRRYPAAELVELYHERWEIESGVLLAPPHLAVRPGTALPGRCRDPAGAMGSSDRLPGTAPGDGRGRRDASRHGSGPSFLHRRPGDRQGTAHHRGQCAARYQTRARHIGPAARSTPTPPGPRQPASRQVPDLPLRRPARPGTSSRGLQDHQHRRHRAFVRRHRL